MNSQGPTAPALARRVTSRPAQPKRRDTSRTKRDIVVHLASRRKKRTAQPTVQEIIGAFRLLEPIIASDGSELHLAERIRTGAPSTRVVLELVRRERESFEADKESLLARASMLADDAHPNWVTLIDAGEEEDGAYLAVEHIDGTTLERLSRQLRKKHLAFPIEIACLMVLEILRGIHAAIVRRKPDDKSMEIILRDITPGNVLISRTGQIKLSHSAFVPAHALPSSATVRAGERTSYVYLAPELVEKSEFTARSAIYSAGVIFHELLGGSELFEGASHYQVLSSVLERGISARDLAREGVPEELIAVVARATCARPADRFQKASDMADAIEAWLLSSGRPVTPSLIEKFVRDPAAANFSRRVRGSSAIIKPASKDPPPIPVEHRPKIALDKPRRVRERRAQAVEEMIEGVEIVLGDPDERAPSLAPIKKRPRKKFERPPEPPHRTRAKAKKRAQLKMRVIAELIILALAIGAAFGFSGDLLWGW